MNGVAALALITFAVALFVRSWIRVGARLDRDLPELRCDHVWRADGPPGSWACVACPATITNHIERNAKP